MNTKTKFSRHFWLSFGLAAAMAPGMIACSSAGKDVAEQASKGPVILDPRSKPEKVELNRFMQPLQPQQFFAEIQDFSAPVTEAKLRIGGTAIEIPMEKIGGTTWRASLSSDQLKRLAISGKTMEYKADIIARNQNGVVGTSSEPIKVSVATPRYEPDAG